MIEPTSRGECPVPPVRTPAGPGNAEPSHPGRQSLGRQRLGRPGLRAPAAPVGGAGEGPDGRRRRGVRLRSQPPRLTAASEGTLGDPGQDRPSVRQAPARALPTPDEKPLRPKGRQRSLRPARPERDDQQHDETESRRVPTLDPHRSPQAGNVAPGDHSPSHAGRVIR